ncbi:MaoC family dehydratase [Sphingobium sp.]|uniref:MaoC family dehydratase n=1 Tax=Sphingobium sp. TaxID=1912891 RepID=UPI003B3AAD91
MIAKISQLTGRHNYFEDFEVGSVVRHARGKTVTPLENVMTTNLVLNTADGHFNDHVMQSTRYGQILCYGGVNFSLVLGLSSQDCIENAIAELGLNNVRLSGPVFHGDTLYAYSEVLGKEAADRDDAGIVEFRHYGVNQRDELVAQVDRRALIKRRSHWGDR